MPPTGFRPSAWRAFFLCSVLSLCPGRSLVSQPRAARCSPRLRATPGDPAPAGPKHIAFILDGNGRWASEKGLPRSAGHAEGLRNGVRAVGDCLDAGVEVVTLYGMSIENLRRPGPEVDFLFRGFEATLRAQAQELRRRGTVLKVIGDRSAFPPRLRRLVEDIEAVTEEHCAGAPRMTLCVAVCYGSRQEITDAAERLARKVQAGELAPEEVTEERLAEGLATRRAGLPDPDLVIRTGGQRRLSGFLLWQCAYAELHFLDVLWPDFRKEHLLEAMRAFQATQRRFGRTPSQVQQEPRDEVQV